MLIVSGKSSYERHFTIRLMHFCRQPLRICQKYIKDLKTILKKQLEVGIRKPTNVCHVCITNIKAGDVRGVSGRYNGSEHNTQTSFDPRTDEDAAALKEKQLQRDATSAGSGCASSGPVPKILPRANFCCAMASGGAAG